MNTFEKGNLSLAFCTAVLSKYCQVLLPFGEGSRYDLVIDFNKKFYRIQVKTGCLSADESKLVFNTCSNNKGYRRKAYTEDVDAFAVFCERINKVFLVPISKTGTSSTGLRLTSPKNNQKRNILLARDYEISSQSVFKSLISNLTGV